MPDNLDYQQLQELIARPERWTAEDASSVRLMITNQLRAMEALHPKDAKGRQSMQDLVDALQRALRTYLSEQPKSS